MMPPRPLRAPRWRRALPGRDAHRQAADVRPSDPVTPPGRGRFAPLDSDGWIRASSRRQKAVSITGVVLQSEFVVKDRLLKRFHEQIAALERELKFELPKEIQRARELGDLRENAEYKAAKERQEIVNARIAMLKKRVGEISMMNLDRIPRDRAGFGSTVQLRIETGDVIEYQLVMPEDADAEKGMISTSSPIGRALL